MPDFERGGDVTGLGAGETIQTALDVIKASPDGASDPDCVVILRILSLLHEKGIEDPQKLADAAFLLASSKLFTGNF